MKCPLFRAANITSDFDSTWSGDDCIKEECAWWEPKMGKCSVLRMWIALQDIHEVLHDIEHRLDALTGLKK